MDGHSHHDHQKRDLQVSRKGVVDLCKGVVIGKEGSKGSQLKEQHFLKCLYVYMYCFTCVLATDGYCVKVINKPCVREAENMRLISWTLHRGSKQ